jgi:hypothetical protein
MVKSRTFGLHWWHGLQAVRAEAPSIQFTALGSGIAGAIDKCTWFGMSTTPCSVQVRLPVAASQTVSVQSCPGSAQLPVELRERVPIGGRTKLPHGLKAVPPLALLISLLASPACVRERERSRPLPAPRLTALVPNVVVAGQPFNTQPDGSSALAILAEDLFRGSKARWNGKLLETSGGWDNRSLAAIVPKRLTAEAGVYTITVEQGDGALSGGLPFTVLPLTGPAPAITRLYPDSARAGEIFNPQPQGAAMGVTGTNFRPDTVVVFGGARLETAFNGAGNLSALVPARLFGRAGVIEVFAENPDGKRSAPVQFRVQ